MAKPKVPDPKAPDKTEQAGDGKAPRAKRETATVDATALYPLPPSNVDDNAVVVLAERVYDDQTVQVVTDGKSVWKELAQ